MTLTVANNIKIGDRLYWEDPDDDLCSREVVITFVDEETAGDDGLEAPLEEFFSLPGEKHDCKY